MRTDKTTIIKVKKRLICLGLFYGKLDAEYNRQFTIAIKKFQKLNPPLVVDGIIGKNTLKFLFSKNNDRTEKPTIKDNEPIYVIPTENNLHDFYGPVGTRQTKLLLPYPMKLAWALNIEIKYFYCHELVKNKLQNIFEATLEHYKLDYIKELRLDLFGGCLNVRRIRNGTRYSTHSWGIAVDIDPEKNQLNWGEDKAQLAKPQYDKFWEIVEKNGGYSLGRIKNYDFMHFQFAEIS